jgi:hypothetical protein
MHIDCLAPRRNLMRAFSIGVSIACAFLAGAVPVGE